MKLDLSTRHVTLEDWGFRASLLVLGGSCIRFSRGIISQ